MDNLRLGTIKLPMCITSFLLLFFTYSAHSQIIFGKIEGLTNSSLVLLGYQNGKAYKLTSTKSNQNGEFSFSYSADFQNGFYTLYNEEYLEIDFIYTGNPIELKTTAHKAITNAQFTNSPENEIYLRFYKERRQYQMLLNYIVQNKQKANIPDSIVYKLVETADNNFLKLSNELLLQTDNSLSNKYIKALAYPTPLIEMQYDSLYQPFKKNIFLAMLTDTAVTSCADLLSTPFLEYRYNLLFRNFLSNADAQTRINVSKRIFTSLKNIDIQSYFVYYLLDLAQENDDLLLLADLQDWVMLQEQTKVFQPMIKERMEQIERLKIGAVLPNHKVFNIYGDSLSFSDVPAEQKLIVFYSSECFHCHELILQLNDTGLVKWNNKIQPVLVSIEESKMNWANFLVKNNIRLPGGIDNKALYNGTLQKFNIRYTPTMYLVDKQNIILAKPKTFEDLMALINK